MANYGLILLAHEDERAIAKLRLVLARLGLLYRLESVWTAAEVIRYLKGEKPYTDRAKFPFPLLLLLDLKIARPNKFKLLRWIRREVDLRHLAVVVLARSAFDAELTRAYAAGANSFMVVEDGFEALVEQLRGAIQHWMTAGLPSQPPPWPPSEQNGHNRKPRP